MEQSASTSKKKNTKAKFSARPDTSVAPSRFQEYAVLLGVIIYSPFWLITPTPRHEQQSMM